MFVKKLRSNGDDPTIAFFRAVSDLYNITNTADDDSSEDDVPTDDDDDIPADDDDDIPIDDDSASDYEPDSDDPSSD